MGRVLPQGTGTPPGLAASAGPILLAVQTPSLAASLTRCLEVAGLPAITTYMPDMVHHWAQVSEPVAAVIDLDFEWALPVGESLHRKGIKTIALSDEEIAQLRALRCGFIHALPKTLAPSSLAVRIKALIENSETEITPLAAQPLGRLRLDPRERVATWDRKPLLLTNKEFEFLSYLADRAGAIVPKRQIMHAFQWETDNPLQQYVWRLRHELGPMGALHVVNRHGYGYGYLPTLPTSDSVGVEIIDLTEVS